jgi:hypothetical protein
VQHDRKIPHPDVYDEHLVLADAYKHDRLRGIGHQDRAAYPAMSQVVRCDLPGVRL